jgi:F0F1-type ATP synthase epsilon subunit
MMAARSLVRALHSSAVRAAAATDAAAAGSAGAASELTLTLAVPHRPLVSKKQVKRVTLPGRGGTFGLEKNSPPMLSELKPGLVRIDHLDNTVEDYFIPGGFSFKHPDNTMDVSSPEGVKLEHIDVDALRQANAEAIKKRDAAAVGSKDAAEANITLEVYKSLAAALKMTL